MEDRSSNKLVTMDFINTLLQNSENSCVSVTDPLYEQKLSKISNFIFHMDLDGIHDLMERTLSTGLEAVASSKLSSSSIAKFGDLINIFEGAHSHVAFSDKTNKRDKAFRIDFPDFLTKRSLAFDFVWAVRLNEDNYPRNLPTISQSEKEARILDCFDRIHDCLEIFPDVFGDKTQLIYDGIARRIQDRWPRPINTPIPPFPLGK